MIVMFVLPSVFCSNSREMFDYKMEFIKNQPSRPILMDDNNSNSVIGQFNPYEWLKELFNDSKEKGEEGHYRFCKKEEDLKLSVNEKNQIKNLYDSLAEIIIKNYRKRMISNTNSKHVTTSIPDNLCTVEERAKIREKFLKWSKKKKDANSCGNSDQTDESSKFVEKFILRCSDKMFISMNTNCSRLVKRLIEMFEFNKDVNTRRANINKNDNNLEQHDPNAKGKSLMTRCTNFFTDIINSSTTAVIFWSASLVVSSMIFQHLYVSGFAVDFTCNAEAESVSAFCYVSARAKDLLSFSIIMLSGLYQDILNLPQTVQNWIVARSDSKSLVSLLEILNSNQIQKSNDSCIHLKPVINTVETIIKDKTPLSKHLYGLVESLIKNLPTIGSHEIDDRLRAFLIQIHDFKCQYINDSVKNVCDLSKNILDSYPCLTNGDCLIFKELESQFDPQLLSIQATEVADLGKIKEAYGTFLSILPANFGEAGFETQLFNAVGNFNRVAYETLESQFPEVARQFFDYVNFESCYSIDEISKSLSLLPESASLVVTNSVGTISTILSKILDKIRINKESSIQSLQKFKDMYLTLMSRENWMKSKIICLNFTGNSFETVNVGTFAEDLIQIPCTNSMINETIAQTSADISSCNNNFFPISTEMIPSVLSPSMKQMYENLLTTCGTMMKPSLNISQIPNVLFDYVKGIECPKLNTTEINSEIITVGYESCTKFYQKNSEKILPAFNSFCLESGKCTLDNFWSLLSGPNIKETISALSTILQLQHE